MLTHWGGVQSAFEAKPFDPRVLLSWDVSLVTTIQPWFGQGFECPLGRGSVPGVVDAKMNEAVFLLFTSSIP